MGRVVYVYNGLGVSEVGYRQLLTTLVRCCAGKDCFTVQPISPEEIIKGSCLGEAALVAIGGGFTSGFHSALGDDGIKRLKAYVQNGGSYLGIGAGGYFGCDFIEFDRGGALEKFAERDLRFYPGTGVGPAYPGFQYGTNQGVHAAPIHFSSCGLEGTLHAFLDGGGMFLPSDPPKPGSHVTEVNTIATFQELSATPAAVVHTRVGRGGGSAVLSGVHLEYDTVSVVSSDPSLQRFRPLFEQSEQARGKAFRVILGLLGVQ